MGAENKEASQANPEISSLIKSALENGTFGDRLSDRSLQELIELKRALDACRDTEMSNASSAKVRFGINQLLGLRLFSLSDIKKKQDLYNGLNQELDEAGKTHQERIHQYFRDFQEFLFSLGLDELGNNITEENLVKFVIIMDSQQTPDENQFGKLVISYNATFEENFDFLRQHIHEAIILENERGAEWPKKRS